MWEAIAIVAKYVIDIGGLAGIILIFWMVDRYLLVKDLKDQNENMINAFQANTKAITELSTLINQLCQRV